MAEALFCIVADLTVPIIGIPNADKMKQDVCWRYFCTRLDEDGVDVNERVEFMEERVRGMTFTDTLPLPGVPGKLLDKNEPMTVLEYIQIGIDSPEIQPGMKTFLQKLKDRCIQGKNT